MNWDNLLREYLVNQEGISEIASNGPGMYFIKQNGVRKQLQVPIETEEEYERDVRKGLIERFKLNGNRFVSEGRAMLSDGNRARVHISLPPACEYPQVTIAKKSTTLTNLEELKNSGMFNKQIYDFLIGAVKTKMTLVISGGTGSGKTTLMEAMTKEFSNKERIGVCEDAPELNLSQSNVVYLHSTVWSPGMNENDVATLSWCVQQLNRQRVDRILVGETRGKEFADFIVAANSGNDGSMTTLHANDGKQATRKMAGFITKSGNISTRQAYEDISETVNLIIQIGINKAGRHKLMSISEVTAQPSGSANEGVVLQELFTYEESSDSWIKNTPTDALRSLMAKRGFDAFALRPIQDEDAKANRSMQSLPRSPLSRFQSEEE